MSFKNMNANRKILNKEKRLKGIPLSQGTSIARVCMFNEGRHNNLPEYKVEGDDLEKEKNRYQKAVQLASKRLEKLIQNVREKIGNAEAEIFTAQKMILEDISFQKKVIDYIDSANVNAEKAVLSTSDYFEARLMEVDDEYLKERASDIGEVKRRLLDVLSNINPSFQCSGEKYCQKGKNRIIVAKELTPSLTLDLDAENTLGFVTEKGGMGSHAAILARAFNIPAVSGIKNIHSLLSCGAEVLIDGNKGEVIVYPTEQSLLEYPDLQKDKKLKIIPVPPISKLKIMANINQAHDVLEANFYQAEGIGLYRTEFEFLKAGKVLNEDEQFELYVSVLEKMPGKPVYFRLLDIGGDKSMPFLNLQKEENPYLGFRGSRLLLGLPEIFNAQVRALARASKYGIVNIMYPMVIGKKQFLTLKNNFFNATKGLSVQNVKHGVMFEVPSACFQAKDLLETADFGSIGSNDLIQYFFAVDRNNEQVAYDYSPDRKVFWDLIKSIIDAAAITKRPLSICGEMASVPEHVKKLIYLGINMISISPKLISNIRNELTSECFTKNVKNNGDQT